MPLTPNGNDGINFSADAFVPHPRNRGVQTKLFLKERNAAGAHGILNGIHKHARSAVAQRLPRTFGVVASTGVAGDGGGIGAEVVGIVKIAGNETLRIARIMAAEDAAPQPFQRLRGFGKKSFVRLRGRCHSKQKRHKRK